MPTHSGGDGLFDRIMNLRAQAQKVLWEDGKPEGLTAKPSYSSPISHHNLSVAPSSSGDKRHRHAHHHLTRSESESTSSSESESPGKYRHRRTIRHHSPAHESTRDVVVSRSQKTEFHMFGDRPSTANEARSVSASTGRSPSSTAAPRLKSRSLAPSSVEVAPEPDFLNASAMDAELRNRQALQQRRLNERQQLNTGRPLHSPSGGSSRFQVPNLNLDSRLSHELSHIPHMREDYPSITGSGHGGSYLTHRKISPNRALVVDPFEGRSNRDSREVSRVAEGSYMYRVDSSPRHLGGSETHTIKSRVTGLDVTLISPRWGDPLHNVSTNTDLGETSITSGQRAHQPEKAAVVTNSHRYSQSPGPLGSIRNAHYAGAATNTTGTSENVGDDQHAALLRQLLAYLQVTSQQQEANAARLKEATERPTMRSSSRPSQSVVLNEQQHELAAINAQIEEARKELQRVTSAPTPQQPPIVATASDTLQRGSSINYDKKQKSESLIRKNTNSAPGGTLLANNSSSRYVDIDSEVGSDWGTSSYSDDDVPDRLKSSHTLTGQAQIFTPVLINPINKGSGHSSPVEATSRQLQGNTTETKGQALYEVARQQSFASLVKTVRSTNELDNSQTSPMYSSLGHERHGSPVDLPGPRRANTSLATSKATRSERHGGSSKSSGSPKGVESPRGRGVESTVDGYRQDAYEVEESQAGMSLTIGRAASPKAPKLGTQLNEKTRLQIGLEASRLVPDSPLSPLRRALQPAMLTEDPRIYSRDMGQPLPLATSPAAYSHNATMVPRPRPYRGRDEEVRKAVIHESEEMVLTTILQTDASQTDKGASVTDTATSPLFFKQSERGESLAYSSAGLPPMPPGGSATPQVRSGSQHSRSGKGKPSKGLEGDMVCERCYKHKKAAGHAGECSHSRSVSPSIAIRNTFKFRDAAYPTPARSRSVSATQSRSVSAAAYRHSISSQAPRRVVRSESIDLQEGHEFIIPAFEGSHGSLTDTMRQLRKEGKVTIVNRQCSESPGRSRSMSVANPPTGSLAPTFASLAHCSPRGLAMQADIEERSPKRKGNSSGPRSDVKLFIRDTSPSRPTNQTALQQLANDLQSPRGSSQPDWSPRRFERFKDGHDYQQAYADDNGPVSSSQPPHPLPSHLRGYSDAVPAARPSPPRQQASNASLQGRSPERAQPRSPAPMRYNTSPPKQIADRLAEKRSEIVRKKGKALATQARRKKGPVVLPPAFINHTSSAAEDEDVLDTVSAVTDSAPASRSASAGPTKDYQDGEASSRDRVSTYADPSRLGSERSPSLPMPELPADLLAAIANELTEGHEMYSDRANSGSRQRRSPRGRSEERPQPHAAVSGRNDRASGRAHQALVRVKQDRYDATHKQEVASRKLFMDRDARLAAYQAEQEERRRLR